MKIVRTIAVVPTLLTLGNAFCGFLAIAYVADALGGLGRHAGTSAAELLDRAAWLVLLAMVFDALDGRIARLTRRDSSFGAELDSLCDTITFGVAPAFLVKVLVETRAPSLFSDHPRVALWFSVLFVVCAVLRLARYNVENITGRKGPTHYFVGLPTPAAAGVLASLVLVYHALLNGDFPADRFGEPFCQGAAAWLLHCLPFLMVGLGLLMISRVPFSHMLNRLTRGRRPFTYVIALVFFLIVAFLFRQFVLAFAFAGYVLVSVLAVLVPGPWHRQVHATLGERPLAGEDDPDDDEEEED